jgi:hypothetical protein
MTEAAQDKRTRNVVLLWALTGVCFGLFNAVYWPVRSYHQLHASGNYLNHAERLWEAGDRAAAVERLRSGIAAHHPVHAAPWRRLQNWYEMTGRKMEADTLAGPVFFYTALASPEADGSAVFRKALDRVWNGDPLPALRPPAREYTATAAESLLAVIGPPFSGMTAPLSFSDRLALLELCGAVRIDGVIGGTGTAAPASLLVLSTGGPRRAGGAHILYRGRDYGNHERGMYCVFIDPGRGAVITTGEFDIWESVSEADRMTVLLRKMPPGTIGAFAVYDEASINLTPELEEELLAFGLAKEAVVDRRAVLYGIRYGFAAIGVRGAAPGTAMQAWSPRESGGREGHPVVCAVFEPAEEDS